MNPQQTENPRGARASARSGAVHRWIKPVDVLYLRGNQLFGGAGDHAGALMPPWPSIFSGAIRSRMLADHGVDLGLLSDETVDLGNEILVDVLGTPKKPGTFRLSLVALGSKESGMTFHPMPADLNVILEGGEIILQRLVPVEAPERSGGGHSGELPLLPVARPYSRSKAEKGYWITGAGLKEHLGGRIPSIDSVLESKNLWKTDPRLGIARSRQSGTAEEGKIYTTDTIAMEADIGFMVGVEGCDDALVPSEGLLRLGGDGRGAGISPWDGESPISVALEANANFSVRLIGPGIFPGGWLPPGVISENGVYQLRSEGLTARLAAGVVGRAEIVSGWDIAAHRPKPAQRAVPAGSVYFFDQVQGDPALYLETFWDLIEKDLGEAWDTVWKQRKAEGFGSILLGNWPVEACHD